MNISTFLAVGCLVTGITLGCMSFRLDLRVMHTIIGFGFIFIVTSGTYKHLKKIYMNQKNYIGWIHILMFSALLFISIRMIRAWNKTWFRPKQKVQESL